METNPKVDFFFAKAGPWRGALEELRRLSMSTGLKEDLKWGCPCYTLNGANVVLLHHFKEYCAMMFIKGALLDGQVESLIQPTETSQSSRQMRFVSLADVEKRQAKILEGIHKAIEVEKAGKKVALKEVKDFAVPAELEQAFADNPTFKKAFEALTPGRQRGYLLHFGDAKQAKTRQARVDKYYEHILAGKGLED